MSRYVPLRYVVVLFSLSLIAVPEFVAGATPVKVYILLGQSNMVGMGEISGMTDGTLDYAVYNKGLYPYLDDGAGNWSSRNDVRHVYVQSSGTGAMSVLNNEWMGIASETADNGGDGRIGPEYGIGQALGEAIDAPVLVLKSCIGNRSLGWDLLPPGSEGYDYDGYTYAGYGESPLKWPIGTTPEPITWKAGTQYDGDIRNAKTVLDNLSTYVPGATEYEIAGFFFWQGDKDRYDAGHASHYEQNLVHLIDQLRVEFDAPNANFVCATLGQTQIGDGGNEGMILDAQLAVSDPEKYPQFKDNVATVYTNPLSLGGASNSHYNGNAETYMNVGEAMGEAMVSMIRTLPYVTVDQQTGEIKIVNPADGDVNLAFKDVSITSPVGALNPANWIPIAGNYDLAGDRSVDADGNWSVTVATAEELSEAAEAGGGDGLLSIAQEVSLGVGAWIQNPARDLKFYYTDADGIAHRLTVQYLGTNIAKADMNFDGTVDGLDWPIFLDGSQRDLSGMSAAEAYQSGDLDGDGDSDIWDFALFREAFEAANPAPGAFEAMVASYIPEPGTLAMLGMGGLAALRRRRSRRPGRGGRSDESPRGVRKGAGPRGRCFPVIGLALIAAGVGFGVSASRARAEIVFSEDFESPDVTGGYNNGVAPPDWVKAAQGYGASSNGLDDKDGGDFTAPEGNDQAYAFRYTNSGLTSAEGVIGVFQAYITYTVSCNVATDLGGLTVPGTSYGVQLIAFADGVPRDDCRSTPAGSYQLVNETGKATANDMSEVVTFSYTPLPGDLALGMDIGVRLKGATESAMVDNVQVNQDASNVPVLTLRVDPVTGESEIRGDTHYAVGINYYQITSAGGSLDASQWTSLADQDFEGNGPVDGTGDGWEEAGGSGASSLAEGYLLGNSDITIAQSVSLGKGYNPAAGAKDLVFLYSTSYGEIIEGTVEYATSALPGDANLDGVVDAADYVALKAGYGTASGATYGDGDFDLDGDVDADDLAILNANMGQVAGQAAVPEPASVLLLVAGAAGLARRQRRGRIAGYTGRNDT